MRPSPLRVRQEALEALLLRLDLGLRQLASRQTVEFAGDAVGDDLAVVGSKRDETIAVSGEPAGDIKARAPTSASSGVDIMPPWR